MPPQNFEMAPQNFEVPPQNFEMPPHNFEMAPQNFEVPSRNFEMAPQNIMRIEVRNPKSKFRSPSSDKTFQGENPNNPPHNANLAKVLQLPTHGKNSLPLNKLLSLLLQFDT